MDIRKLTSELATFDQTQKRLDQVRQEFQQAQVTVSNAETTVATLQEQLRAAESQLQAAVSQKAALHTTLTDLDEVAQRHEAQVFGAMETLLATYRQGSRLVSPVNPTPTMPDQRSEQRPQAVIPGQTSMTDPVQALTQSTRLTLVRSTVSPEETGQVQKAPPGPAMPDQNHSLTAPAKPPGMFGGLKARVSKLFSGTEQVEASPTSGVHRQGTANTGASSGPSAPLPRAVGDGRVFQIE